MIMEAFWIILAYFVVGLIACALWNVIEDKKGVRDVSPITWQVDHHYETVFIWPVYLIMLIVMLVYCVIYGAVEGFVNLVWRR